MNISPLNNNLYRQNPANNKQFRAHTPSFRGVLLDNENEDEVVSNIIKDPIKSYTTLALKNEFGNLTSFNPNARLNNGEDTVATALLKEYEKCEEEVEAQDIEADENYRKLIALNALLVLTLKHPNFDPNVFDGDDISLMELALSTGHLGAATVIASNPKFKTPMFFDPVAEMHYYKLTEKLLEANKTARNVALVQRMSQIPGANKPPANGVSEYLVPIDESTPKSLDEIGGMDKAKKEIERFIINPWKPEFREAFKENNITMPNGFLMYGPPGCGKTYIVKTIAAQMKLPLYKLDMGKIGEQYAYATEKNYAKLFNGLKEKYKSTGQPSILFIDEIDSACGSRKGMNTDWRKEQVNALLQHLNNASENGIILIGATNRVDSVDEAVLRTGRFDKKIEITKPCAKERKDIIQKLAKKSPLARNAMKYIDKLVEMTENASCSDISAMFNEALRNAIFESKKALDYQDFDEAYEGIKFNAEGTRRRMGFNS